MVWPTVGSRTAKEQNRTLYLCREVRASQAHPVGFDSVQEGVRASRRIKCSEYRAAYSDLTRWPDAPLTRKKLPSIEDRGQTDRVLPRKHALDSAAAATLGRASPHASSR